MDSVFRKWVPMLGGLLPPSPIVRQWGGALSKFVAKIVAKVVATRRDGTFHHETYRITSC